MRIPTRKSELMRALDERTDYSVTPAKLAAMQRDLERLTKVERPQWADEVARTSQMGDLSENAAYQVAKNKLRQVNSRILSLDDRIKKAVVIEVVDDGKVHIGSTVTVQWNTKELTFTIVGSQETNPAHGTISRSSPLGEALLGAHVGDEVSVKTPQGKATYKVLRVAVN
ncbi:transcription elongation factor GreA [Patescibacteria group bacterium]|nr:transcription elongation factor GreA [Patescibacteria group bacterium]